MIDAVYIVMIILLFCNDNLNRLFGRKHSAASSNELLQVIESLDLLLATT
jgi:succinylglutamate desuccinylase